MSTIIADHNKKLVIGRQDDNETTTVLFPIPDGYSEYDVELLHKRPGEEDAYIVDVDKTTKGVEWIVNSTDTQFSGTGAAELRYSKNGKVKMDAVYSTLIENSIADVSDEVPEPFEAWYDKFIAVKNEIATAKSEIEDIAETINVLNFGVSGERLTIDVEVENGN